MTRRTVLVVLLALVSLVGAGTARPDAGVAINGTVTLDPFDVTKKCKFDGSVAAARMGCTVYGTFVGKPVSGGAGYGWLWTIPKDERGVSKLYGSERGTLLVDLGALGVATLTLKGQQHPIGKQTADHSKVTTTGTWTMTSGTGRLVGGHGRGRYSYTIVRNDSPTVFERANVVLSGRIVRGLPVA